MIVDIDTRVAPSQAFDGTALMGCLGVYNSAVFRANITVDVDPDAKDGRMHPTWTGC